MGLCRPEVHLSSFVGERSAVFVDLKSRWAQSGVCAHARPFVVRMGGCSALCRGPPKIGVLRGLVRAEMERRSLFRLAGDYATSTWRLREPLLQFGKTAFTR
jgi:hypothetical protein